MNDCTCIVENCERGANGARGMCSMHYSRFKRGKDLLAPPARGKWVPVNTLEERLRRVGWKVTATGCWEFAGCTNRDGYGCIYLSAGVTDLAHRVSYRAFVQDIPAGMYVMHSCDNPPCINPSHLSLGTQRANMGDCSRKNRAPHGERSGCHKLSDTQVREIRELAEAGIATRLIADRFPQVHKTQIQRIIAGKQRTNFRYAG